MRRPNVCVRLVMMVLAFVAVGCLAGSVWAATKTLSGRYTVGQVGNACVAADGTSTGGTGPGGYGCRTSKGSVSCDKNGKCTGTCGNCAARTVPKKLDLDFVLRDGAVSKPTTAK